MHIVEIGLSFLEGLALIASPCILPVLPLVLGASVEGGKKRPFGIITGFVLAFTAFAMLSRELATHLGINLEAIKYGSLLFLGLFGLVLLSERLSAMFSGAAQRFASTGSSLTAHAGDGFFSGIFIGMFIGLIWTPCAGPILAAALVQIIRQESNLDALFLVGAFAIGAGLPMLAIALGGRRIIAKLGFFTAHAQGVRRAFGVLILLAVAFIAAGGDATALFAKKETASVASAAGLQDALPAPYPAPEFAGIQAWLNSQPLTMASLKGKVVLVDFWTYSCINCIRTLPYITTWDEQYRDQGLVIIGVSAPEFEFEKNKDNVEAAVAAHHIRYPVALDNALDTWTAFHNRYWPAHYLIDREGRVVYTHFGEGHYLETENNIRYLLGLAAKAQDGTDTVVSSPGQTPETYLGKRRAERFASPETLGQEAAQGYSLPPSLPANHWALAGRWSVEGQRIVAQEAGAALRFNFTARKVFLVVGTQDGAPVRATVTLNGHDPAAASGKDAAGGQLTVREHALYELVNQNRAVSGLLEIKAEAPGLEAYAFTFGD